MPQIMSRESNPASEMMADELASIDVIDRRIARLTKWLQEVAPEITAEQDHLNEGSRERSYWHYGYLVALRDVRKLIAGSNGTLN